jgi:hypothetical protein
MKKTIPDSTSYGFRWYKIRNWFRWKIQRITHLYLLHIRKDYAAKRNEARQRIFARNIVRIGIPHVTYDSITSTMDIRTPATPIFVMERKH